MLFSARGILCVFGALVLVSTQAFSDEGAKTKIIIADNVTGLNRFRDKPLRDFGLELGGTFGFHNSMAYNPDGDLPTVITEETPSSALLATGIDPVYAGLFGLVPEELDTTMFNIPYREVGTIFSEDGEFRTTLPSVFDADITAPSQAEPLAPITLETWTKAKGVARVQCYDNGHATVTLRMKRLLPNRLYTVWSLHATPAPRPFGGAPNAFVTNKWGNATWQRDIGFCPMADSVNPLKQLSIVYHSDHLVYGDLPGIPLKRSPINGMFGLMTGTISHSQLEFAFRGERVE